MLGLKAQAGREHPADQHRLVAPLRARVARPGAGWARPAVLLGPARDRAAVDAGAHGDDPIGEGRRLDEMAHLRDD
jgi:hypothetical protein